MAGKPWNVLSSVFTFLTFSSLETGHGDGPTTSSCSVALSSTAIPSTAWHLDLAKLADDGSCLLHRKQSSKWRSPHREESFMEEKSKSRSLHSEKTFMDEKSSVINEHKFDLIAEDAKVPYVHDSREIQNLVQDTLVHPKSSHSIDSLSMSLVSALTWPFWRPPDQLLHTKDTIQSQSSLLQANGETHNHWQGQEDESTGASSICSTEKAHHVHRDTECPDSCPFSQILAADPCTKVCVGPDSCALYHSARTFADPVTKKCVPTCGEWYELHIVACVQCSQRGKCGKCAQGHTLSEDGQRCVNDLERIWPILWCGLLSLIGLIVMYMFFLANRPTINSAVLYLAEEHRRRCKPQFLRDGEWHKYPLCTTLPFRQNISGVGVILYFRWLAFMAFIALILLTNTYIAFDTSWYSVETGDAARVINSIDGCPLQRFGHHRGEQVQDSRNSSSTVPRNESLAQGFLMMNSGDKWMPKLKVKTKAKVRVKSTRAGQDAEDGNGQFAGTYDDYTLRMFIATTFSYVLVVVLSLIFSAYQLYTYRKWDETHATHKDFAVEIIGLPQSATNAPGLKRKFQDVLEDFAPDLPAAQRRVIGVSIAYNYKNKAHEALVTKVVGTWVEELTEQALFVPPELGKVPKHGKKGETFRVCMQSCEEFLQCADDFVVKVKVKEHKHTKEEVEAETIDMLKHLQGSGRAIVIVSSEQAVHSLVLALNTNQTWVETGPPEAPSNQVCRLEAKSMLSEPIDIVWSNFAHRKAGTKAVVCSIVAGVIAIKAWAVLYLPYALFYSFSSRVPGERPGATEDLLLGLLIALGNALVGMVIDVIADWARFRKKDRRDVFTLSLAFVATLLNTGCDLLMVLTIAKGSQLDEAFLGSNTGYDRVFARELMVLLVPGYLILPYVLTPIFDNVLPYYIGRWLVRSRNMRLMYAEQWLLPPDFDICWRYSDSLNNFTVCLSMMTFSTPNSWRIMAWLFGFFCLLIVIDTYKLLRGCAETFFTTERLSAAFELWWSVPTGCLGGIAFWWAVKADYFPSFWANWIPVFILLHILVYISCLLALRSLIPQPKPAGWSYEECEDLLVSEGMEWTAFNTNPIFCLRQKMLGVHEPGERRDPCIPFVRGKQYLYTPSSSTPYAGVSLKVDGNEPAE